MLANKPKSFCKTCIIDTEYSDCHKKIVIFLRVSIKGTPSNNIVYSDYKHFN